MPPETCKVARMEEWLLDLVHTKWRALVVVACLAWVDTVEKVPDEIGVARSLSV
jgi:hypothetical protein